MAARSCPDREASITDEDSEVQAYDDSHDDAGAYKVLDAVLLRRRRGHLRTETLAWRVSELRGHDGEEVFSEVYPDRERALLVFYSG